MLDNLAGLGQFPVQAARHIPLVVVRALERDDPLQPAIGVMHDVTGRIPIGPRVSRDKCGVGLYQLDLTRLHPIPCVKRRYPRSLRLLYARELNSLNARGRARAWLAERR